MAAPVITFVPTVAKSSGDTWIPLAELPAYIGQTVEEAYTALKTNDGNFHVEFPNKAELLVWEKQMKSYAALRMVDGKPAPIHYRRSPVRNQPDGHVNFRITDVPEKNTKDSKEINDAAAKVTAAAKTAAAKK